jgi:hypothetical protein
MPLNVIGTAHVSTLYGPEFVADGLGRSLRAQRSVNTINFNLFTAAAARGLRAARQAKGPVTGATT